MNGLPCQQSFALVALLALGASQVLSAPSPTRRSAAAAETFVVPPGFDVRLFAGEPMIVNPVAMTWDARGRLWVVERHESPLSAKQRSEERRVGKECRSRWSADDEKKEI